MESPVVGYLVAPAPSYREAMETGESAAVLMGILRGNAKLYYPATDRSFWAPVRRIRSIPPKVLPETSLERFLSYLLLFLEATECSVVRRDGDAMSLEIELATLERARLDQLLDELGERVKDWVLEPGSMRALLLKLELVSLPRAAGAGR